MKTTVLTLAVCFLSTCTSQVATKIENADKTASARVSVGTDISYEPSSQDLTATYFAAPDSEQRNYQTGFSLNSNNYNAETGEPNR